MALNHTELKKALKILAENPSKIEFAKQKYNDRMKEIRAEEAKGIWSPKAIEKMKSDALAERDRTAHALAHAMKSALEIVKANNDFQDTAIDLSSPKLQNALSVINALGKNMPYSDQISLCSQFVGDIASLRVIEGALKNAGLNYGAKQAHELQRQIPNNAITEMETVLAFHDYAERQNRLDFPISRAHWTKGEFKKAFDRLGYDSDSLSDPYSLSLELAMDNLREKADEVMTEEDPEKAEKARAWLNAEKLKIEYTRKEIQKAKESGEDPSTAFNNALRTMEKVSENI